MQPTNKVLQGQTFVDMVCQQAGSFEEIINTAILNGKSVTGDLVINEEIQVSKKIDMEVISILSAKRPASGITISAEQPEKLQGIGYWIIGDDNIIS